MSTLDSVSLQEEFRPSSFTEVFYGILFNPVETFSAVASESAPNVRYLGYGLALVLLVSGIGPLLNYIQAGGASWLMLTMAPLSAIGGAVTWGLMGGIVSLLAYIFTGRTRITAFLTLSAFAVTPWLLMAPLLLLKLNLGDAGFVLGILGNLAIWAWSVALFLLAVGKTYHLSTLRVWLLFSMPLLFFIVFSFWIAGFVINVTGLFS